MDHDRLFKELLTTFFVEFLELFFPDTIQHLDRDSIEFLDKEVFTDVTEGERREVDLVAKARFRDRSSFFLIHVENQGKLQLDPARRELISGFVDAYLRLTMQEENVFRAELRRIEPERRERVMKIVTSWMEQGIQQGIEQGIQQGIEQGIQQGIQQGVKQGKSDMVLRMLRKRLGSLDADSEGRIARLPVQQLEALGEALLDFTSTADLASWLDGNEQA